MVTSYGKRARFSKSFFALQGTNKTLNWSYRNYIFELHKPIANNYTGSFSFNI